MAQFIWISLPISLRYVTGTNQASMADRARIRNVSHAATARRDLFMSFCK